MYKMYKMYKMRELVRPTFFRGNVCRIIIYGRYSGKYVQERKCKMKNLGSTERENREKCRASFEDRLPNQAVLMSPHAKFCMGRERGLITEVNFSLVE